MKAKIIAKFELLFSTGLIPIEYNTQENCDAFVHLTLLGVDAETEFINRYVTLNNLDPVIYYQALIKNKKNI